MYLIHVIYNLVMLCDATTLQNVQETQQYVLWTLISYCDIEMLN